MAGKQEPKCSASPLGAVPCGMAARGSSWGFDATGVPLAWYAPVVGLLLGLTGFTMFLVGTGSLDKAVPYGIVWAAVWSAFGEGRRRKLLRKRRTVQRRSGSS